MTKLRVVHYINQFFAQIGGEDKADIPVQSREGVVGPGLAFRQAFGEQAEIVATIICGDTYFNEHIEEATKQIVGLVRELKADIFIAGPAFNAGRYGVACGAVCAGVHKELGIPVLTGMFEENPGADMYKNDIYITATKNSAAGMRNAVKDMVPLVLKLARKEAVGASCEEHYLPHGIRVNFFEQERGSRRAIDMLLKKLAGKPFVTEYPMPTFDRVKPAGALQNIERAKVALVTSGGIVPKGNPDHIESSSASKYGAYDLTGVDCLTSDRYETAHGGYDTTYANADPNRVLPVDVMRDLEKEGKIGSLYNTYFSTVGNGTAVAAAKKFAVEIVRKLKKDKVDAVVLTST